MSRALRLPIAVSLMLVVAACRDASVVPSAPQASGLSASVRHAQGSEVLVGAVVHRTVGAEAASRGASRPTRSKELAFRGGSVGVETAPKIYLVVWGSQWNSNDPSGEVGILRNFFSGMGGTSWLATVTQYCEGVATGTIFCNNAGTAAGNQSGMFVGVWYDNTSAAPSHPTQSQLASEAVERGCSLR